MYLLDGTNCSLIASAVTGKSTSLIPAGETAVSCKNIGGQQCIIIAPTVGILGTPVIDEDTNHIYLVTYSQIGDTYYHRVHALFTGLTSGTTPLAEDTTYNSPQIITSGGFTPSFSSFYHIQRPGLLLLPSTDSPKPALYIGFSMMDGATNYPQLRIPPSNADNLGDAGGLNVTEPNLVSGFGGGIWMDGAGLSAGLDSAGGSTYLYLTTADGIFDSPNGPTQPCVDCADSFVKLTSGLVVSNSFTPADEACRFYFRNPANPMPNSGQGLRLRWCHADP